MNKDDNICMAREAGIGWLERAEGITEFLERFANLIAAAEREKVAKWMIQRSYATGHGETIEDLLAELDWQIAENWNRAMINGIETEREACAKLCEQPIDEIQITDDCSEYKYRDNQECADAIRARGQS